MASAAVHPVLQPSVDIPQLQTPIPPGNERHRSINAGTGELRPLSSRAMAPPAPASAFQACAPRPVVELARGGVADVNAWPVPDVPCQPATRAVSSGVSATDCASRLGERTAGLLRGAMIAQQDMFTEQLWELHRLTRVQGQKSLRLSTCVAGTGSADNWVSLGSTLFSRQLQSDLHTETMESIASLPTVPATLRQHPTRKRKRPQSAGPSDTNAHMLRFEAASGGTGKLSVAPHGIHSAAAPPSIADCATQQSHKAVQQGTLDSLCKQHNIAAPAMPSTNTAEAPTQVPSTVPPLESTAAPTPDVSSLLNLMLPSTGVNPHMQWFRKNGAPAFGGDGAVPGPVNAFHQTMDVPLPEPADPKAVAPSAHTGISSSLWSNSSLAFLPGTMQAPFAGNSLGDQSGNLLPYPTMPKFGPDAFRLPSQYPPMPLPQGLLGAHLPMPGDGHVPNMPTAAFTQKETRGETPAALPTRMRSKRGPKPANSTGSGNSQRFSGAHSQLDAVPMYGTQQGESLGAGAGQDVAAGDTDKSAADILLSLRGR